MPFFMVIWRIENFSMCPHQVGEELTSPEFTMPEVNNVKWNLLLYPRGNRQTKGDQVSVFITRSDQAQSSDIATFITSLIIVNSDSNLSKKISSDSFPVKKNSDGGYRTFLSHEKLYQDPNGFLPNDVLTFQVQICPKLSENCSPASPDLENIFSLNPPTTKFTAEECFSRENETNDVSLTHCSFTTRIPVERRIFNWTIEEFSAKRKSKEKMSSILDSQFHEGIKLQLVCYVEGSTEENENLRIDILRKGMSIRRTFAKCVVSFLDSSDVVQSSNKSEHVFGETYSIWSVSLIENINSSKGLIKNDSIKLKFDFRISYDPQNVKYLTKSESCPQNDLQKEIQEMLEHEETTNVCFECKYGKKFPLHQLILCAKSPVFRAMFSSDTLEKQTGVVRMLDTDTTTVQHLRDYLYSDSLPDLEIEDILKLYSVADKYNIEKLKDKCSAFLKNNISADSVCEILTIADIHNDHSMKDYVNDFLIAEMDLDSDLWKTFTKENSALAAETMRKCIVKMKGATKN